MARSEKKLRSGEITLIISNAEYRLRQSAALEYYQARPSRVDASAAYGISGGVRTITARRATRNRQAIRNAIRRAEQWPLGHAGAIAMNTEVSCHFWQPPDKKISEDKSR